MDEQCSHSVNAFSFTHSAPPSWLRVGKDLAGDIRPQLTKGTSHTIRHWGKKEDIQGYGAGLPQLCMLRVCFPGVAGHLPTNREQGTNSFCFACVHSFAALTKLSSPSP